MGGTAPPSFTDGCFVVVSGCIIYYLLMVVVLLCAHLIRNLLILFPPSFFLFLPFPSLVLMADVIDGIGQSSVLVGVVKRSFFPSWR